VPQPTSSNRKPLPHIAGRDRCRHPQRQHQGGPDSTQPGVIRGHEDARLPRADLRRADLPGHPEAGVPVRRLSRSRRRSRTSLTARQHGRTRGSTSTTVPLSRGGRGRQATRGRHLVRPSAIFRDVTTPHATAASWKLRDHRRERSHRQGPIARPSRSAVPEDGYPAPPDLAPVASRSRRLGTARPPVSLVAHHRAELGTTPPHAAVVHEGRRRVRGDRIQRRCAEAPRLGGRPTGPGSPSHTKQAKPSTTWCSRSTS
jgi:hypothetical protein